MPQGGRLGKWGPAICFLSPSPSLSHTFSLTLIFNCSPSCRGECQEVAIIGTWVQDSGRAGDSEACYRLDSLKRGRWCLPHLITQACSLFHLATGLWKSPLDHMEGGGLGNPWLPTAAAPKSSPEPAQPPRSPAAGRETRPEMKC